MTDVDPVLVTADRGDFVEKIHRGAFAVVSTAGELVAGAGDLERRILPRSAIKILQALPLVESGAAAAAGLGQRQLALACASHQGSSAHARAVAEWLGALGLHEGDLECGPQIPNDPDTRHEMRQAGETPCQLHNNCSGKHAGFLTLARHLGASTAGYVERDHPVQQAVAEAFGALTGADAPLGWAVDGCSAPNFAASVAQVAHAMARLAAPEALGGMRGAAARALYEAMAAHPFEVAGEGRACTELIGAAQGRAVVKTGADGYFTAILPEKGLGIALKIADGDKAAAECAIANLLIRFGALDPEDSRVATRAAPLIRTRREKMVGGLRAAPLLTSR